MSDSNDTKFRLDLDNAEFVKKLLDSKQLVVEMGDSKNLEGLTRGLMEAGVVAGTLGVAFFAAKAALDAVFNAEEIKQVNAQFQMMATNSGVASEKLKTGMEAAAKGLIDENTLLKLTNQGLAELGTNAEKLPQVMELARKVTAVFGGDLSQRFSEISQAIASGQTRMLKHIGLTVDATAAQKAYAAQLGITVDQMTESDKQASLMNAVLEKGGDSFKGVNVNITEAKNTWEQLKSTFIEIKDTISLVFEKYAGPVVRSFLKDLSLTFAWLKNQLVGETSQSIEQARQKAEEQAKEAAQKRKELEKDNADERRELGKQQEATFQKEMAKIRISALKAEFEQTKEHWMTEAQYRAEIEQRNQEEISEIHRKAEIQIQELEAKRSAGKLTSAQYAKLAEAIETDANIEAHNKKMELVEEEKKKLQEFYNWQMQYGKNAAIQTEAGWKQASLDMINSLQKSSNIGSVAFKSLEKQSVAAFKAMGDGSKSAGEALKGALFGSLADIAEAKGEYHIAEGLASMNPLEFAEGGVLVALAGFLRSQAGSSSSSSGSSGASSAGGGGGGGPTAAAQDTTKPTPDVQQKKTLTVNFQGPVFDTDATRTRLVELIRESSDYTDFNILKVGQN